MELSYTFTNNERKKLKKLLNININPYKDYQKFKDKIAIIIQEEGIGKDLYHVLNEYSQGDFFLKPVLLLENCPIDINLPILDLENPVIDKRNNKLTYISEAFLELIAQLLKQIPISYINVNDGDIFQDIHPMESMKKSQSQKASDSIFFHKDLANHFVRPNFVNILGLRSSSENKIFTSVSSNKNILKKLSHDAIINLSKNNFYTPYDDLTVSSSNKKLNKANNHSIINGNDICFFENRTKAINSNDGKFIEELISIMHEVKKGYSILPGTFVGVANDFCIHNKEVIEVKNKNAVMNRWLMKTVNVSSLEVLQGHTVENNKYVVNG